MREVNSMLEIEPGPDEEWKYIDSYGDWYEISNYGRIRTWRSNKLGQRRKDPRYLSGFKTPQGYIRVMLNKDNHEFTD